jgi:hypothetical protein
MLKASFRYVDLSTAATMYYFMASGGLELNGSRHHVPCIDVSAAATMYYFMAGSGLELNGDRNM